MPPKPHTLISTLCILTLILSTAQSAAAQSEDLSVISRWMEWADAQNSLQRHLNSLAFTLLDQRSNKIKALRTASDWQSRKTEIKATLDRIVGPFPQKTPLNPKTLGVVKKNGYRIEKIVFESLPGFYVTACLFIPDGLAGKAPAILNVIGHTDISFRGSMYQRLLLNLVQKKFIVLAMDPVGQGERLQYYDPAQKRSLVGGSTTEHSYAGKQNFLIGSSAARYFTWDGIRAIDFLVSRPEVDPGRIGVTGLSGGGTQTSYISAFDDRVAAAAPTCYITGFRRLLESIGPQDAEQNFNAGLANGIDHADFLEVRAPKPTLVVATTRDFFSIQGARETVAEARQAFRALGAEDNLSLIEDDFGHGYTRKNREGIYAFFQKHLKNPGSSADQEIEMLTVEELTITRTGQVGDSLGGETVFSLNAAEAKQVLDRLQGSRKNLGEHLKNVKELAQRASRVASRGLSGLVFRGQYPRDGYRIEMHAMTGERGNILPFLFMIPETGTNHPALIYLHPQGKSAAASPGGEIEWFVKQGYAVLAPDLSGTGESGSVSDSRSFLGVLLGQSIAAIRAADILKCAQFLKDRSDVKQNAITAVARRSMAIPLLFAALSDSSIQQIALVEPLVSFQSVVMNRYYNLDAGDLIGSVLTAYDIPDLEAAVAPRRLMIVNTQDHLSKPASGELKDSALEVVRRAYAQQGMQDNLSIRDWQSFHSIDQIFSSWLKQ